MVEQLNSIARLWWEWSAAMFWQVGLLILVIATIDRLTRRWAWPQLRYALWSLILIKLLLPPSLSLPSSVVPSLAPVVKQALARLQSDKPAAAESRATLLLNEDMLSNPMATDPMVSVPPILSGGEPVGSVPVRAYQITPYGVTTNEPVAANVAAPSSVLGPLSSVIWQVYVMMASLAGTLILGIWLFVRLNSLVGRRAQEAAAASLPQSFYNQLAGCARRLELGWIPRVVVTRSLATPAVFGVFRPVLLMPKGYLSKLSRRDTEHMLLHELAHIKRGDLFAHGLYMLLQVVYWYNPLLWLVRRQVHHLRELSCDATVAELLREQTMAYRQTLLETARRLLTSSVEPGLGLLGLFEDSNRLLVRLDWLTKPTWRYRTMKRVTVATIAALMLACVLPMARAQEAASHQPSREVVKHEDPSSQEIAALQARLEELTSQQRLLQAQLEALRAEREGKDVAGKIRHAPSPARVQVHASKKIEKGDVTVVPWQKEDPTNPDARKLRDTQKAEQTKQEHLRAMDEKKMAQMEAQRAQVEAQRAHVEAMKEAQKAKIEALKADANKQRAKVEWVWSDQMKGWHAQIDKGENSEEMQQWQEKMEQWGEEMEKWGEEIEQRYEQQDRDADDNSEAPAAGSVPSMPAMPAMPAMPPMPPMSVNVAVPQVAPTPQAVPHVEAVPAVPASPQARKEPEELVPCGEFLVESLPAGTTLQVENGVGSVAIRGGDERDCTIQAVARIRGVGAEEAEQIAEEIVVQVAPADGRVRVSVQMPDGMSDDQRNRIAVDLRIAAPADAQVQTNQRVGNVSLSGLQGKATADVDVGAIDARGLQGDVSLRTNVGDILFAAPADLSAKIQAQTKVGSISSSLPLEVTGAAVLQSGNAANALGSHAKGTLGDGKNKIELRTNVGSIRIQQNSPSQEREAF